MSETPQELLEIVKMNGGGNFTASVYLREDGFFVLFNTPFLERIAAAGKAERFAELLEAKFKEALGESTKESKCAARLGKLKPRDARIVKSALSCVPVRD